MKSALQNHDIVEQYLAKEVSLGRITGPYTSSPLTSLLHTTHFGVIPMHDHPWKWQLILDLSFPPGSVNDSIDNNDFPLSYSHVDDAIHFIMQEGRGTLLANIDIHSAYHLILIDPHDLHLLGMSWDNQLYVDLALPFSLHSTPFIFNQFVKAWHIWVLHHRHGICYLLHYLDDYLTAGAPNSWECHNNLSSIRSSASSLGILLALEKATVLSFLGIKLDTRLFVAHLPTEKLSTLQSLIQSWSHKIFFFSKKLLFYLQYEH